MRIRFVRYGAESNKKQFGLISSDSGGLFEPELRTEIETDKALFVRLDVRVPFLEKLRDELVRKDFAVYEGSEYVVRSSFHASLLRDDKPAGKSFDLSDFSSTLKKYPLVEDMFEGIHRDTNDERDWKYWMHQVRWTLLLASQTGERMKFPLQ